MFQNVSMWARRAVAYPLVFVGAVLTEIAGSLIRVGAWLLDRDDVLKEIEKWNS